MQFLRTIAPPTPTNAPSTPVNVPSKPVNGTSMAVDGTSKPGNTPRTTFVTAFMLLAGVHELLTEASLLVGRTALRAVVGSRRAWSSVCAAILASHVACGQPVVGLTTDAWDFSRGTVVTASSPLDRFCATCSPNEFVFNPLDAFGACQSQLEPCRIIFADDAEIGDTPPNHIYFLEWTTINPIRVERIDLYHQSDPSNDTPSCGRAISTARFWGRATPSQPWTLLANLPSVPLTGLPTSSLLPTLPAPMRYFRAEFTRPLGCNLPFREGPRIVEIDAIGTVECDSVDFNNNNVFPEDADVIEFFNVLAGAECPTCNDIDFNNNTVFPEDQDVIDFFTVLAGGTCP